LRHKSNDLELNLHSPIQAPILNCFSDAKDFDIFRAGELGDGAADFEHAAVGSALRPSLLTAVSSNFSAASFAAQSRSISLALMCALA